MLPNPPPTKDTALDVFLRKVQQEINNKVKSLFIPVASPSGQHGKHTIKNITATNKAYFEFAVPQDVNKIQEATVRFIPTVTGTMDWTFNVSEGSVGEDENQNTATVTADGKVCTDDQVQDVDVTSAFTNVDRGDQVGCEFVLDAVTTTTDLNILGLLINYI